MPNVFTRAFPQTADDVYDAEDAIDYAGHLQLDHFGKNLVHYDQDDTPKTIRSIIHKEKKEQRKNEHGFDEVILRAISFPANDITGRTEVLIHQRVDIGSVKYTIDSLECRLNFWHLQLRRSNVGEISRPHRRGRI